MPILHVEVVGNSEDFSPDLAQDLADEVGNVLQSRPQGTWVKLQFLNAAAYAENSGAIEGLPIIVSLNQAEPPTGDALKRQVASLAQAIAQVAGRPVENVHIIVEPAAKGRIAFGGNLLE